jgi:hypothetical protein
MLIPLGFLASSSGGVDTDYELIETVILGSAQSSVTFSSLGTYSSTYKHLQVRGVARDTNTYAGGFVLRTTFNGSSSGYAFHYLQGNGSSVSSSSALSQSYMRGGYYNGAGFTANSFGVFVFDVLDAYNASKTKTLRTLTGVNDLVGLLSGLWNSTAAISSITMTTDGTNFATGSRFSLYGIKG